MSDKIVYLIDKDRLLIRGIYSTHKDAENATNGHDFDFATIGDELDLKEFSNKQLTNLYNNYHKGYELKKFDTLSRGMVRVWEMITHMDQNDFTEIQRGKKVVTNVVTKERVSKKNMSKKKIIKKKTVKASSLLKSPLERQTEKSINVKRYDDGKRMSVSSEFIRLINGGCDRGETLDSVRKSFPERNIPDSYYKWYINKVNKGAK